ncbi:glycerol-3-phosphate dehydrogenase/oxidase [Desulfonatronum thiodismutans]|uniref:glycerol-3-phosphate dehydrogenase/oxidase n=1 Tax=Desulfonatronum thiodismutans TaxID=159290 RepID=UPI0005596C46|nr:glycerol-3-phosphate dehydrogenase/oxidase [Desulfonatronum thiodismutans]
MMLDLREIASKHFDILVVGGGVNGACVAWDAAMRGLSVALVDKNDFGAATSAATGRMIHGGIRYLQHLALGRVRTSLHERIFFLRSAPHLVHPVPFLIPTYGHGLKGKEVLSLAMTVYDLLARTEGARSSRRTMPGHKRLSRQETLASEPHLLAEGLTGAIRFYDCQMPFPERLTLAIVLAARREGAEVLNYAQVKDLLVDDGRVTGANVMDVFTGSQLTIKADLTVNAAGPWVNSVLKSGGLADTVKGASRLLSKGIHIITRSLTSGHALALATRHKHSGAWLDRGGRHFFIVPWQGLSLIGTTNSPFNGAPDDDIVTEEDIRGLIDDVNSVYPAAGLCRADIRHFYGGLYPDDPSRPPGTGYQGSREDNIIDHGVSQNIQGLISVIGVKYTTARLLAQKIVDLTCRKLARQAKPCRTESAPLFGGGITNLKDFVADECRHRPDILSESRIVDLIHAYGTNYTEILELCVQDPDLAEEIRPGTAILKAQVVHAVRREMARNLQDVVFRRTPLGCLGRPAPETLRCLARIMAEESGWDDTRREEEVLAVDARYLAK